MRILALDTGGTEIKSSVADNDNRLSDMRTAPSNLAQDDSHISGAAVYTGQKTKLKEDDMECL